MKMKDMMIGMIFGMMIAGTIAQMSLDDAKEAATVDVRKAVDTLSTDGKLTTEQKEQVTEMGVAVLERETRMRPYMDCLSQCREQCKPLLSQSQAIE